MSTTQRRLDLLHRLVGTHKEAYEFLPKLKLRTPIVAAELENRAGIVGAAWIAANS